jgi:Cyclic nucleotide-binding domain
VQTLARHSTLSTKDQRAIRKLHPRVTTVERGADIVRQGDRPHVAVMVISGMLARYHTMLSGHRQYLSLHVAGDLPDLQSLFLGIMDHSVCAVDEAEIASFLHSDILALVKCAPSAGLAFWRHTLIDGAIFRQAITSNGRRSAIARDATPPEFSVGAMRERGDWRPRSATKYVRGTGRCGGGDPLGRIHARHVRHSGGNHYRLLNTEATISLAVAARRAGVKRWRDLSAGRNRRRVQSRFGNPAHGRLDSWLLTNDNKSVGREHRAQLAVRRTDSAIQPGSVTNTRQGLHS